MLANSTVRPEEAVYSQNQMISFEANEIAVYVQSEQHQLAIGELTYLLSGHNSPQMDSALLVNRGTLHWLMGDIQSALEDFQASLQITHLNYASYFNIHSLCGLMGNHLGSLHNLCCAISCLYLIKGGENDILESIRHCSNNLEARLAKGLDALKKGKQQIALYQIQRILQQDINNQKLRLIKTRLLQSLTKQGKDPQSQISGVEESEPNPNHSRRLRCSLYHKDEEASLDLPSELKAKLQEFNGLYFWVNKERHRIIHQYPPVYMVEGIPNMASTSEQGLPAVIFPDTSDPISERSSMMNEVQETASLEPNPQNNQNVSEPAEQQRQALEVETERTQIVEQRISQEREYRNEEGPPITRQSGEILSEIPKAELVAAELYSPPRKSKMQSDQDMNSSESRSFLFMSPEEQKNLSIRVHKIEIPTLTPEERDKMTNIYCLFEYGRKKFTTKNTTPDWNQQLFDDSFETELEDQPQVLKIRVLNKEVLAFADRELGRGEKEITMTGRIQVGLGREEEGEVGRVVLDIRYK